MQSPTRNVGILIFNEVEVLDFCGPFEVLARQLSPTPIARTPNRNRSMCSL